MSAQTRGVDPVAVQRRTLGVLSGGVALSGLGITVGITVGGLLARDVAGTETAAGLGQTAGVLGPAARPARRPARSLIRASGTATTAAPSTPAV